MTSNHVLTVAHAAEMATLSFRARALMVIQEPHARQVSLFEKYAIRLSLLKKTKNSQTGESIQETLIQKLDLIK